MSVDIAVGHSCWGLLLVQYKRGQESTLVVPYMAFGMSVRQSRSVPGAKWRKATTRGAHHPERGRGLISFVVSTTLPGTWLLW